MDGGYPHQIARGQKLTRVLWLRAPILHHLRCGAVPRLVADRHPLWRCGGAARRLALARHHAGDFCRLAPCVGTAGVLLAVAPRPSARLGAIHLTARQAWPPEQREAGYHRFLGFSAPLQVALAAGSGLTDGQALRVRLLLIHDYRRLRLRDPMLPDA